MGFLQRLLNSRATLENPRYALNSPELLDALGGSKSAAGERVNARLTLTYSPFWRGVNLLSRDVAKLPLLTYVRRGEGKERDTRHAVYKLLRRRPNGEMTAFVFKQTLMSHALLEGNGYAYIFRRGDGSAEELIPLLPGSTYPVRVNGKLWYVTEVNAEQRKLPARDVFHIKGLGFDGLSGYPLWMMAKDTTGLGLALRKYGSKFFQNNAQPGIIIEHPHALGPEAAANLMTAWDRIHAGLDSSHRTAVLEEGAKATVLKSTARESQLIETRQFELREVANWLNLPPHKLGDTTRTAFASLEQENQSYLDDALDPWLVNFEEEAHEKLLTEREKDEDTHVIEFLREALVRTNLTDRANFYRVALGGRPWMKQNEVRARENLNPVEGGDTILDPLNMGDAGGADNDPADPPTKAKPAKKPAAEADEDEDDDDHTDDRAVAPIAAARAVLIDGARRMVKRLAVHARRKAGAAEVRQWLDGGGALAHRDVIAEAITPAVRLCNSLSGRSFDPGAAADALIARFAATLAGADDAAGVEERLADLEQGLPDYISMKVINGVA